MSSMQVLQVRLCDATYVSERELMLVESLVKVNASSCKGFVWRASKSASRRSGLVADASRCGSAPIIVTDALRASVWNPRGMRDTRPVRRFRHVPYPGWIPVELRYEPRRVELSGSCEGCRMWKRWPVGQRTRPTYDLGRWW